MCVNDEHNVCENELFFCSSEALCKSLTRNTGLQCFVWRIYYWGKNSDSSFLFFTLKDLIFLFLSGLAGGLQIAVEQLHNGPQALLLSCCLLQCRHPSTSKIQKSILLCPSWLPLPGSHGLGQSKTQFVPSSCRPPTTASLTFVCVCVFNLSRSLIWDTDDYNLHKYDWICHSRYFIFKKGKSPCTSIFSSASWWVTVKSTLSQIIVTPHLPFLLLFHQRTL